MTGEMSNPVDRDEWPLQAAIADATNGELRAFDVYQGPYVLVQLPTGRMTKLWVSPSEEFPDYECVVYREDNEQVSQPFPIHIDDALMLAGNLACELCGITEDTD